MNHNTNLKISDSPNDNKNEFVHNIFLKKLLNKSKDSNIIKKDIEYLGKNIASEIRNIFSDEETKKKALDYLILRRERDKSRNQNKTPKNPSRTNKEESPFSNTPINHNQKNSAKNSIHHNKYYSMDPKRKKYNYINENNNSINININTNNKVNTNININTTKNANDYANDVKKAKSIINTNNYFSNRVISNQNHKNLYSKNNNQESFTNTFNGGFNRINKAPTLLYNYSNNIPKT